MHRIAEYGDDGFVREDGLLPRKVPHGHAVVEHAFKVAVQTHGPERARYRDRQREEDVFEVAWEFTDACWWYG